MNEINKQSIANKLRELRGDRTQKEVADAIGVTPMAISQYEQAERIPNDEIKIRLAHFFDVKIEDLFFKV